MSLVPNAVHATTRSSGLLHGPRRRLTSTCYDLQLSRGKGFGDGNASAGKPIDKSDLVASLGDPERTDRIRHVAPRLLNIAIALLASLGRLLPALEAKAELARIGRYDATESMLLWDEASQTCDAEGMPSFGCEALCVCCARVLRDGLDGHELGQHGLF